MKRQLAAVVSFTLLSSMLLPSCSTDITFEIAGKDVSSVIQSQKLSKETLELAGTTVQKLEQHPTFIITLGISLDEEYEVAKRAIPEMEILEAKSDASLALIEVYEEMLIEFRKYDIDRYYAYVDAGKVVGDDDYVLCIWKLFTCRNNIEAMLALDCYYDLLDEDEIQRMNKDFEEFADLDYASRRKTNDEAGRYTLFEIYRTGLGLYFVDENGERHRLSS